ncbi:MAG TPA: hypothetical protein VEH27_15830 [Methylomirabilota bacterium]|nr:hypothetical protein [Methylomirabilota bacterium]
MAHPKGQFQLKPEECRIRDWCVASMLQEKLYPEITQTLDAHFIKTIHFRLAQLNVPPETRAMYRLPDGPVPCYLRVR